MHMEEDPPGELQVQRTMRFQAYNVSIIHNKCIYSAFAMHYLHIALCRELGVLLW